jgi:hypothetical protein
MISVLLLIQRIFFLIVLFANYFDENSDIDSQRLYLNAIGVAIHLVAIGTLFLKKKTYLWQMIHAPVVMLSYLTYVGNIASTFNDDQLVVFVGQ